MSCGADTTANALIISLTAGKSFAIPEVDFTKPEFQFPYDPNSPLYGQISPLTVEQLTSREPGGTGVFDALMDTYRTHLREEMEKGRITGAEYTKAYIALAESAMNQAAAFLLGKDQAFWQAQTAQIGAVTARIGLETAKVQLAAVQLEALNQEANYALAKLKLATEDMGYCTAKYNLETILPAQYATIVLQQAGLDIANDTATYNLATTLPLQTQLLTKQNDGQGITNNTAQFQLSDLLPQQLKNLKAQETLVREQMEVQRGQTHDMRTDNIPVAGVLGKQKLLYSQQVTSYQRDAEVKAAKMFSDAWITMKTLDDGLLAPTAFNNSSVDEVMYNIKYKNGLYDQTTKP